MTFAAVALGFFLLIPGVASSVPQDPARGDEEIKEARVEGNLALSEEQVLDDLRLKVGSRYNAASVRDGIRDLWRLSRVVVVEVRAERLPAGGLRVLVRVEETPEAGSVEIRGNVQFNRKDLLEAAGVAAGAKIDEITADRVRRELLRFYRDRGYVFAEVLRINDREGHKVIYEVMEGPLVRIRSIELTGQKAFPASTFLGFGKHLTTAMELHGKFLFFKGSEFSERKLRQDLVALRKFYRNEGYRDAVVEAEPPTFSEDGSAVELRILIDEGPRYRVASVDLRGVGKAFTKQQVMEKVRLKPGDPYTYEAVLRDFRAIQKFYGENGFPQHPSLTDSFEIRFPPQETFREDENEALVDVVYEITENSPKRTRDIRISGNRVTQDRVIRRELTFYPGDLVNQDAIEQSMRSLEALQYFDTTGNRTTYRYVDTPDPSWKDIEIEVAEGRTGSVSLAGGITSNDGLFLGFTFKKTNFDLFNFPSSLENALPEIAESQAFTGAGQELVLSLTPGIQLSQYDLRFTEPDLFGDQQRTWYLSTDFFYRVREFSTNREDRLGESVTLGKSLDRNWTIDTTLRNEDVTLRDISADAPALIFAQEGSNSLRSINFGFGYRDVDSPIEPRSGFQFRFDQESAGVPFNSDLEFLKSRVLLREWIPLGTNLEGHPHTLYLQGRGGISFPTGGSTGVPFSERFFMGGEGSLRGFAFRGAGPVQFGTPIGGEALWTFTAEYTFPLFATRLPGRDEESEILRGVLFNDWGALGLNYHDPTMGEIRSSVGFGIAVKVPFLPQLPIAIHFGIPWLRRDTDDTRLISFTIGRF